MSLVSKVWWAIRAILLTPFFGRIGMPSYIGSTTFLLGTRRMRIGRNVRIFPGLRAEVHGDGHLVIEDNVAIAQSVHITAMGDLRIGAGTAITAFVMITDMDHGYSEVGTPVVEQPLEYRRTRIGRNCFIGQGAKIQAGTTLGDGCVVGANAVVRGDFPPNSVIVGMPGRIVKRYHPDKRSWERPDSA